MLETLSLIGSFFLGWLVATDKNRNEIFKKKIEIYHKFNYHLSRVLSNGIIEADNTTSYKKEKIKLADLMTENSIFLSDQFIDDIQRFLYNEDKNENLKLYNNLIKTMSKEIKIPHTSFVNEKLLSLPTDIWATIQETKNKTKE